MGSSPKPPQQSSSSKKLEQMQIDELQRQKEEAAKPADIPVIPAAKPLPPPAIPTDTEDAVAAEQEARQRALRRTNAGRNTLFAGETGGYRGAIGGNATLLG